MSTDGDRTEREAQLRAFYAREVGTRAARELSGLRTEVRAEFIAMIHREGRRTVLEVGCGAGQDGSTLVAAGFDYTGVDLTPESVAHCRTLGLDARVASAIELPFPDGTFDAAWTMSTLMHLAVDDQARAVAELARVVRPGAPVAIGVWGSDTPGVELYENEFGERYFATIDDDSWRAMLGSAGTIERFVTWPGDGAQHYQWAVVRTGPAA